MLLNILSVRRLVYTILPLALSTVPIGHMIQVIEDLCSLQGIGLLDDIGHSYNTNRLHMIIIYGGNINQSNLSGIKYPIFLGTINRNRIL